MVNGIIEKRTGGSGRGSRTALRSIARTALCAAAMLGLGSMGCAAAGLGQDEWEELEGTSGEGGGSGATRQPATPSPEAIGVFGHAANGDLVLFSAATGELIATRSVGPDRRPGPSGSGVDLAYDHVRREVVRVSSPPLGRAANVVSYELVQQEDGSVELGRPWRWGWAAHGTASRPVEAGLLLFEPGATPRWRLLDDDGVTRGNVSAPMPRSVWTSHSATATPVKALVQLPNASPPGGPGLAIVEASPHDDGAEAVTVAELSPGNWPLGPEARMCPWPSLAVGEHQNSATLLVDVDGGVVRLRWGVGAQVGAPVALALPAPVDHVLDVAVVEPTAGQPTLAATRQVLLLVDEPGRFIAVRVAPSLEVEAVEQLGLDGELPSGVLSGRALLPVTGRRVMVGTSRGIRAFELSGPTAARAESQPAEWRSAPDFDGAHLRGPMAGPVTLNL